MIQKVKNLVPKVPISNPKSLVFESDIDAFVTIFFTLESLVLDLEKVFFVCVQLGLD